MHPSISPRLLCRSETRERAAHGTSLKCVVRLSPLIIASLSPTALKHAVKTQHGSLLLHTAPYQGCVALRRGSRYPGSSLMDADRRAELHTAMPIQRLPLNLPPFISCPLPSPCFQGGVPEPCCQHVMSLPIVGRNN